MRRRAALALLLLVACTHQQAYVASGETLAQLGPAFKTTGLAMDAALDAHLVTPEQYRRWAAFAKYFKPTFDLACARWLSEDATASQHATAVLTALGAELATWTATAQGGP